MVVVVVRKVPEAALNGKRARGEVVFAGDGNACIWEVSRNFWFIRLRFEEI